MKVYAPQHIRNIALLGHAGSGKTTIAEAMLFNMGVLTRRGTVEERNTTSDFNEIEHERGGSIYMTPLFGEINDTKINILDTPGYDDYIGEIMAALRVVDLGIFALNAQSGVEVTTEIVAQHTEKLKVPSMFLVNKLELEQANFDKTLEQVKDSFGLSAVAFQYPLNQGPNFNTIVDVFQMKAYQYGPNGGKAEEMEIPADEMSKAETYRSALIEAIAEVDEDMLNKYFEAGELTQDEIRTVLPAALRNRAIMPVFCSSSKNNMGIDILLDFIATVAPSPVDMPATILMNGNELPIDPKGSVAALAYKNVSEPNVGELMFFKVFSGTLTSGLDLYNSRANAAERIGQLFYVCGKKRVEATSVVAGDLCATVKLKSTHINDTLKEKSKDIEISPIPYPRPKVRISIEPKIKGEEEKLGIGLNSLHLEDPTFIVEHSQELHQMILYAQGELHLGIAKYRLEKRYKVDIEYHEPKVPYRETIQRVANGMYRHKKQSGGAGQFAEVHMRIEPYYEGMPNPDALTVRGTDVYDLAWGGKLVFLNCIVGGVIEARFLPAILKGVNERMTEGPLTGSYVRDIRVSIFDGKMHPVDSNEAAFKTAGKHAFKECFTQADPKILEPIYEVDIVVPNDFMGEVMSDLPTRRGIIMGMDAEGRYQKIKARMPLAEVDKYSSGLRAMTQGRAFYTAEFAEYQLVPAGVQQKLMAEYQAKKHEED